MYIFYFLSVASLALAGIILSAEWMGKKITFFKDLTKFTKDYPVFGLILGIVVLAVGAFKFAITVGSNGVGGVPVVGDFFPAIGGVLGGVLFIMLYIEKKDGVEEAEIVSDDGDLNALGKIKKFLLQFYPYIGLALIVIAVVHLFVPQVLFL